ncbi:S24 family peptidase [Rhizobium sp. NFR12]|uniref:XRE family transcriptional regulator n=1 Tax=Rhizobium sp. NFR12 TaxID=1566261 RepID=UPI0008A732CD|nr:S24 family peptidase [Rhizobium sp. NFR12]SEH22575.1 Phage repressor protein C, contains Cro/C1-type HTH and peptisase s24 domains [Rhizobium sp. NFR12]
MGRPAKKLEGIGARLAVLREGRIRKEFAKDLGVPDSTLGNYERGDRLPDWSFLETLHQRKGVNLNWLLSGVGEIFSASETGSSVVDDNVVRLPRFDARASAGKGLIPVNELPVGEVAFARDFLRNLGASPDHCYVLEARGDSMWPTIPDGALLIADSSKKVVDDGRIYHFNVMDRALIKRARWTIDGKLFLTSDNVAAGYAPEEFTADRVDELQVSGRIMFTGHAPLPVR